MSSIDFLSGRAGQKLEGQEQPFLPLDSELPKVIGQMRLPVLVE